MIDGYFLAITLLFVSLSLAMIKGCQRLERLS